MLLCTMMRMGIGMRRLTVIGSHHKQVDGEGSIAITDCASLIGQYLDDDCGQGSSYLGAIGRSTCTVGTDGVLGVVSGEK